MKKLVLLSFFYLFAINSFSFVQCQNRILGEPVDMSRDFSDFHNTFFFLINILRKF